ncbi:MAG: RNA polymerase sigma factor [Planctomycetes bacterium]|nr:RNA polymerase sigma factor [Planctomycetota bacterium]
MARSDAELVKSVLRGEAEDFRELLERHQDSIYRVALRCNPRAEFAEEVTQEAFTRAFEHLSELRDPGYFYGWLRQIALRLCTDWLRARNGHPRSLDTLREQGLEVGVSGRQPRISTVETVVQKKAIQEIVLSEVGQLAPDFRQILMMRYFEGLSIEEIAQHLELNENTVKVRLFRAREALRPRLQELYSKGDLTSEGMFVRPV